MPNTPHPDGLTALSALLPGLDLKPLAPLQPLAILPVPTKQARYHYTTIRQTDQLATIGEQPLGEGDMGFMNRLLTLCSLPRTDPGDRLQYKRQNGPYKLVMLAGGDNKLPFGNLSRLLLAWVCTEAVRTQDPKLHLGRSLSAFMQELGIKGDSGGTRGDLTRLKTQIDRLFNCHIDLIYDGPDFKATTGGRLAKRTMLWWDYHQPEQQTLWKSWVELSQELFQEIIDHPVPLNMQILKAMRRSSLGLDLYMWLSYKTFSLYSKGRKSEKLSWERLYRQFGSDPSRADDRYVVRDFAKDAKREIRKLKLCWPDLQFSIPTGGLEIRACPPSVPPRQIG
jgi:hypothetical protein